MEEYGMEDARAETAEDQWEALAMLGDSELAEFAEDLGKGLRALETLSTLAVLGVHNYSVQDMLERGTGRFGGELLKESGRAHLAELRSNGTEPGAYATAWEGLVLGRPGHDDVLLLPEVVATLDMEARMLRQAIAGAVTGRVERPALFSRARAVLEHDWSGVGAIRAALVETCAIGLENRRGLVMAIAGIREAAGLGDVGIWTTAGPEAPAEEAVVKSEQPLEEGPVGAEAPGADAVVPEEPEHLVGEDALEALDEIGLIDHPEEPAADAAEAEDVRNG